MSLNKTGIIIVGGTGYGAKEFLRLSLFHPFIEIVQILSSSASGKKIGDIHKELEGLISLSFESSLDLNLLKNYSKKFIILALPHGESLSFYINNKKTIEELNIHIIDLSGDFRLKDISLREKHYGHLPKAISLDDYNSFTYGLSELNKNEIKKAKHIANPGCYPTASLLAIAPLIKNFELSSIVIDGKSGSSGAGRSPSASFHHPELNANSFPYKVLEHRHEPEMLEYGKVSTNTCFMFVPHVIPISRGMLITSYIELKEEIEPKQIELAFTDFYKNSKFIRLRDTPVEVKNVCGSNFCDIFLKVREKQVVVCSTIDNLVKGMAGQAIQNINIISNYEEDEGLKLPGLGIN